MDELRAASRKCGCAVPLWAVACRHPYASPGLESVPDLCRCHRSEEGFHLDRTAGRNCDHCHPGGNMWLANYPGMKYQSLSGSTNPNTPDLEPAWPKTTSDCDASRAFV